MPARPAPYDPPMPEPGARPAAEITPVLLGVVTIVSGVATGLFSDLRLLGKLVGLAAVALWVVALGVLLWRLGRESGLPRLVRIATFGGFVLTAALLVIALQTGPRLSARTLVVTDRAQRLLGDACAGGEQGPEISAHVALSQIDEQFVHVELEGERCRDRDIRIRSEDVIAVLPDLR